MDKCLCGRVFLAVLEAIAITVHFQDVDAAGEAAQQRADEPFLSEYLSLFAERQVGGHPDGVPLAALAKDLEGQFGTG